MKSANSFKKLPLQNLKYYYFESGSSVSAQEAAGKHQDTLILGH